MQSTAPQFDFNQPILAWSPNLAVTSITHAGEPVRYREDVLAVPAPLGSCGSSTGAPPVQARQPQPPRGPRAGQCRCSVRWPSGGITCSRRRRLARGQRLNRRQLSRIDACFAVLSGAAPQILSSNREVSRLSMQESDLIGSARLMWRGVRHPPPGTVEHSFGST
jgi:hypothetical protein